MAQYASAILRALRYLSFPFLLAAEFTSLAYQGVRIVFAMLFHGSFADCVCAVPSGNGS